MTRITIGPFNRVEGDLEVRLDVESGRVQRAEVTAPLYRGFEQILEGRPPLDALVLAPRICGICSVSQSVAAAAALRHAMGTEAAPNGLLATNIAHAAENAADHLTHFYIFFMPDFAREAYASQDWYQETRERFAATRGSAARDALPARARLLETMGIIAGKWPHSLAFQPGGATRAIELGERVRLLSIVTSFRTFLERTVFADTLENMLSLSTADELDRWRAGRSGDFAHFLRLADSLALSELGKGPGVLMSYGAYQGADCGLFPRGIVGPDMVVEPLPLSQISEDVSHAWMRDCSSDPAHSNTVPDPDKAGAYSWCKAPRLSGQPVEVGAIARQTVAGQALIADLVAPSGTNVRNRVIARLIETARIALAMEQWTRALRLSEPFCAPSQEMPDGAYVGLVEAARGSLGHWVAVRGGKIERYQIIAPTTWNFSPRDSLGVAGPLEQALVGTDVGEAGARSVAVQHVVRSFDPCMVCTAH
ncbi:MULTISPECIES: nickel-dependent hydrogenase large subunit [Bradyrhizobium]|uniref:HupV protein n=3 Tax=Bradyrhizobium TaxID=374 RepID=A0AAE6CCQ1_9BRAD|nr:MULTISPECIES: nickel-dependent hydrogenase large subunit [Bradyrhizobium]MCG2628049.1 nickel-dependent hydrogenase large subunit [Bradyrhizobium zhengyangense]MCG2643168.1 nickel-dependent hydrogenase large subunit [Bradyrhizobium zhengyangense]MCG2670518.1 nickel-dependent hydrogenase large subunit [Bradyrhizobium zhengyangense]MDN4985747.1 nickel-dependent hydrogenase large subunit [Bradyrhizobium sp. WYCCWR 13022]MDT4736588.1 nickel-dependent hydrogenase large subunit [Bradyrhizobium sp.